MNEWGVSVQVYRVDPVVESGDPGEDGGFLVVVAAQRKDKAGDAVNLPGSLRVLTVQGTTRVTLDNHKHTQITGLYIDANGLFPCTVILL